MTAVGEAAVRHAPGVAVDEQRVDDRVRHDHAAVLAPGDHVRAGALHRPGGHHRGDLHGLVLPGVRLPGEHDALVADVVVGELAGDGVAVVGGGGLAHRGRVRVAADDVLFQLDDLLAVLVRAEDDGQKGEDADEDAAADDGLGAVVHGTLLVFAGFTCWGVGLCRLPDVNHLTVLKYIGYLFQYHQMMKVVL